MLPRWWVRTSGGPWTGPGPSKVGSGRVGLGAREVDLRAVVHDEVHDLDRRRVDVVEERLRLAVDEGEADERRDGREEAERGAVHGLGDAGREDEGLGGRVRTRTDGAERADEADDGAEEAAEHREVGEQAEVRRAALDAGELLEGRLIHGRLHFLVGAVHLHEARLDDPREGRVLSGAELDGTCEVASK